MDPPLPWVLELQVTYRAHPEQRIRKSVQTDVTIIIACELRATEIVVFISVEIRKVYSCFAYDAVTTLAVRNRLLECPHVHRTAFFDPSA